MRLVTWNVCDGFRRKFGHLERLQPDLAVVQEVRPECLEYAGLQAFWQWNPEKRFHIDFSFATSDLPVSQAILGSYDQYITPKISDHMPLAVDYAT